MPRRPAPAPAPSAPASGGQAGWYHWEDQALILRLRVQPRARSDAFGEPTDTALPVRLRAPPMDGKANAALVAFLAAAFGVPRSRVCIEHGLRGRDKRVRVTAPRRLPPLIDA